MKNSPHRHKHQVKKALRQASHIVLNPKKDTIHEREEKFTEYNGRRRSNERLNPLDIKTVKEIFNIYKHHLERARLVDKAHSKRSTPGMIEGDKPQTQTNQHNPKIYTLRTHQGSLKTEKIARSVLRGKNAPHREAA